VKDFDSLINPSMNTFENIDGLKDVMQRCANDFGTTIIFGSKDTSKLNNEAIQPHRINAWIEVDDKANQKAFDLCKKLEQRKKAIEDSIDSKKIEIKTKQKEVQNLTEELNGFKAELEKLNPVKILTDKLENLPKGKIFQLAAIGAAVGIALVGIKHLISNKNKQN